MNTNRKPGPFVIWKYVLHKESDTYPLLPEAQVLTVQIDEPVPSILLCPKCNMQHVDTGVWATVRVHRTHLCEGCGAIWRPFAYATVGVAELGADAPVGAVEGDR